MGSREGEWQRMARTAAESIGHEVTLARTNLALTRQAASRMAGVSPHTQRRVEEGDPHVGIDTACRVAAGIGLKLWAKAFPVRTPSLRDTGQLRIAESVRSTAFAQFQVTLELGLGNGRAIDMVLFGAVEIIAVEVERSIADFQAQYRSAASKRDELALGHRRPVRLVLVIEDTRRNRTAVREHPVIIASALPARSREVLRALRRGEPLGRDGMLWVRPTG
jgi:hypothetical protein